jgi:hypothetical protein
VFAQEEAGSSGLRGQRATGSFRVVRARTSGATLKTFSEADVRAGEAGVRACEWYLYAFHSELNTMHFTLN